MIILQYILGFICVIAILTIVHELGHFIAARFLGVKVLRFSLGFGKPILSWYDKLGTEYVLSLLPLGGYVRMLGESDIDNNIASQEQHMVFDNKSIPIRAAILIAGPLFNIIFAFLVFWGIFVHGVTTVAPVIGSVEKYSMAAKANLRVNQEIIAINNIKTFSWYEVKVELMRAITNYNDITLRVRDFNSDNNITTTIPKLNLDLNVDEDDLLNLFGIETYDPFPPVVGEILAHSAAATSDLQLGDLIVAADGNTVNSRSELTEYIRSKPNVLINLVVSRYNSKGVQYKRTIKIIPKGKLLIDGTEVGFIGIQYKVHKWPKEMLRKNKSGFVAAIYKAVGKTYNTVILELNLLTKIFIGNNGMLENIAGPIALAKHAGSTINSGVISFLNFLAWVSISLAIINMLPIPMLDGGGLLYCAIEACLGKQVVAKYRVIGDRIGMILLLSIAVMVFYNDLF